MATTAKKPSGKRKSPDNKPPEVESSQGKKASGKTKVTKVSAGKSDKSKPKKGAKKAAEKASADSDEPRRLGVRGAAPWAARHAAKHAAEARARAAEPPPPGSARATLRVPTGAEEIKARVVELHNALTEIKGLRKNLGRHFFAIGLLLRDIREAKLYEARGFGSFETFLDREVDIGKTTSLRLARLVEVFHEEAAISYGMELVMQALATLESGNRHDSIQSAVGSSPPALPMRPPSSKK